MNKNLILEIAKLKGIKLHDDHPMITRRDFLAAGILEFTAFMAAPTLLSSLLSSKQAWAACPDPSAATASPVPSFIHYNISGGCALFNAVPRDQGGQLLPTYSKMGLGLSSSLVTNNKLETEFGINQLFFNRGFIQGLRRDDVTDLTARAAITTYRDTTAFIRFCVQSQDDSPNNPKRILGLLAKAGKTGTYFPNMSVPNFGQKPALLDAPPGLFVQSFGDIQRATLPPGPFGLLATTERSSVLQALFQMNQRHTAAIVARALASADVLQENQTCAAKANMDRSNAAAPPIDPLTNAAVAAVWGINANTNKSSRDFIFASMVYNVLLGHAAFCELQEGGGDYHDNTRTTGDGRDRGFGLTIAKIAQTAKVMGKDLALAVTTDGTVNSTLSDLDDAPWASDQGTQALDWLMLIKGSSANRPALADMSGVAGSPLPDQVGFFEAGQAASRTWIPGWNAEKAAAAMFLNAMAFGGAAALTIGKDLVKTIIPDSEVNKVLKVV